MDFIGPQMNKTWICELWIFKPSVCRPVLACAWFLRIALSANVCMCMCMCPPLRLSITSGVMWTPYTYKFYSFYMATEVIIGSQ